MSRPPSNHNQNMSTNFDTNRGRVIDFVHPLQYGYAAPVHPDYALYAQAGFPGYESHLQAVPPPSMMPATLYANANNNLYNPYSPSLGAPFYSTPYTQPQSFGNSLGSSYAAPQSFSNNLGSSYAPPQDPSDLHQRIETKMDSILNAQKTEALSSQIEKLSDQVHGLTRKMQCNEFSTSNNEEVINNKLKALVAESKKQEAW